MFWGNPLISSSMLFGLIIGSPLACIVPSFALWYMARASRRQRQTDCCVQCGYDLTGNVSGRCSECGRLIDLDSKKRIRVDTYWYPELNLFQTVDERDKAWQYMRSRFFREPYWWVCVTPGFVFIVSNCVHEWMHLPAWSWWWPSQIILGASRVFGCVGTIPPDATSFASQVDRGGDSGVHAMRAGPARRVGGGVPGMCAGTLLLGTRLN